ncbi:MAG: hypothetical protein ACT6QU_14700 [Aliihoeflea sp.]|uniref:hypothetical protein n=1 Tax=Aliihoeflea sp. TaxID=2608088 RepID=UPI0040339D8C
MAFTVDLRAFERQLNDIEKRALPDAARGYLNEIAFQSRTALRAQMEKDFDRPNAFTLSAFLVKKADKKDGQRMEATIFARPEQEEYLRFQVFGGVRRKGDVGATPWDVVVGADKEDRHSNVPRRYLAQTAKKAKRERDQRAKLRTRRAAAKASPKKGKADLSWVTRSKNKPGFFGTVKGWKGYWVRPERSLAAPIRVRGIKSVRTTGRLRALVSMSEQARYQAARFKYADAVIATHRKYGTQARFAEELQRALAKRTNT